MADNPLEGCKAPHEPLYQMDSYSQVHRLQGRLQTAPHMFHHILCIQNILDPLWDMQDTHQQGCICLHSRRYYCHSCSQVHRVKNKLDLDPDMFHRILCTPCMSGLQLDIPGTHQEGCIFPRAQRCHSHNCSRVHRLKDKLVMSPNMFHRILCTQRTPGLQSCTQDTHQQGCICLHARRYYCHSCSQVHRLKDKLDLDPDMFHRILCTHCMSGLQLDIPGTH